MFYGKINKVPQKKLFIIGFLCVASFLFTTNAFAQLTKAERKTWKKELRKLSPEGLKSIMEERKNLSSMLDILSKENNQLKSKTFKQEQEIGFLKTELSETNEKLKTREIQFGLATEEGKPAENGVVFKVQIGAINKEDFFGKGDRSYTLEVESNKKLKQYVVGNFLDYEEADTLKKHIRKIGMNKAWIVPYKNGKRVSLKEVLHIVLDQ